MDQHHQYQNWTFPNSSTLSHVDDATNMSYPSSTHSSPCLSHRPFTTSEHHRSISFSPPNAGYNLINSNHNLPLIATPHLPTSLSPVISQGRFSTLPSSSSTVPTSNAEADVTSHGDDHLYAVLLQVDESDPIAVAKSRVKPEYDATLALRARQKTVPKATATTSSTTPSVPVRPRNAWICYRSAILNRLKSEERDDILKIKQAELSRRLAILWKGESVTIRSQWGRKADAERALHKANFPDYKFQPKAAKRGLGLAETESESEDQAFKRQKSMSPSTHSRYLAKKRPSLLHRREKVDRAIAEAVSGQHQGMMMSNHYQQPQSHLEPQQFSMHQDIKVPQSNIGMLWPELRNVSLTSLHHMNEHANPSSSDIVGRRRSRTWSNPVTCNASIMMDPRSWSSTHGQVGQSQLGGGTGLCISYGQDWPSPTPSTWSTPASTSTYNYYNSCTSSPIVPTFNASPELLQPIPTYPIQPQALEYSQVDRYSSSSPLDTTTSTTRTSGGVVEQQVVVQGQVRETTTSMYDQVPCWSTTNTSRIEGVHTSPDMSTVTVAAARSSVGPSHAMNAYYSSSSSTAPCFPVDSTTFLNTPVMTSNGQGQCDRSSTFEGWRATSSPSTPSMSSAIMTRNVMYRSQSSFENETVATTPTATTPTSATTTAATSSTLHEHRYSTLTPGAYEVGVPNHAVMGDVRYGDHGMREWIDNVSV